MIIQYNKVSPEHRSLVRSIQSKSYSGYIRFLLIKRLPYDGVKKELLRLGLSWNEQEEYKIYFQQVLLPIIKQFRLLKYYRTYQYGLKGERLTFKKTFGTSEKDRIQFINMCQLLEIDQFFTQEIVNHYGGMKNIPNDPATGKPLIKLEAPVDLVGILQNPKRHVIERLLLDGYTPKQISSHLDLRFDMILTPEEIKAYAKSFFNVQRADMERLVEAFQEEKIALQEKVKEIKAQDPGEFTFGEQYEALSALNTKITQIDQSIKRLSKVHTDVSFNAGTLEAADVREMFTDVLARVHKRFRRMDERTEDSVVAPLNMLVGMMDRSTNNILKIDGILSDEVSKSIQEEIADVYTPHIDRLEEEKREAFYTYKEVLKESEKERQYEEEDENDIIGFD